MPPQTIRSRSRSPPRFKDGPRYGGNDNGYQGDRPNDMPRDIPRDMHPQDLDRRPPQDFDRRPPFQMDHVGYGRPRGYDEPRQMRDLSPPRGPPR